MDYFEAHPEKLVDLKTSLDQWIGTPYRHWCAVKGVGADCIQFIGAVLHEIGVIPTSAVENVQYYQRDWHMHKGGELLKETIVKRLNVKQVDEANPSDGDILLYRFGHAYSHSAIYMRGMICQAVNGSSVKYSSFNDKPWRKRLSEAFRLQA